MDVKNTCRSFLALLCLGSLIGCASAPATSGYLANYDRLQPGEHLEKFWANTAQIQKAESVTVHLREVQTEMITDQKDVSVADCAAWLTAELDSAEFVSTDAEGASIRLDLAITFMSPGSAAGRIFAGELGAGHAQVQIEGKVSDAVSNELLATFAERRRSSGAIGIKDLGGDASPGLIEQMIGLVAEDIRNELLSTFTLGEGGG